MSRRSFLKAGTAATAALAMAPVDVLGKAKAKKNVPTGKIKLLAVGVGGRGHADINAVTYKGKDEVYDDIEFIGMCDVDQKYAKGVLEEYKRLFPNMKVYNDYKAATGDTTKTVIASTASPYKFSAAVLEAIEGKSSDIDEYAKVDRIAELSDIPVPAALADLRNKPERFSDVIDKADQKQYVLGTLGI